MAAKNFSDESIALRPIYLIFQDNPVRSLTPPFPLR